MKKKITLLFLLTFLIGGLTNAQNHSMLPAPALKPATKPAVKNHPQLKSFLNASNKATVFSEDFSGGMTDWTVIGEGEACWYVKDTNLAGGTAPELILEWGMNCDFEGISYCMTPAIDTQGYTSLEFEFKHSFRIYESSVSIGVYTTIDDGTTWEEVWVTTISEDLYEVKNFTINNAHIGNSNLRIGFMFSGALFDIWEWAIDDILLIEPQEYDLGVIAIDITDYVESGATVTPKVSVRNFGTNDVSTWSVTLTDGDVYTSTVSDINIPAGETKNIEMDSWTPANGTYTLTATLDFDMDGFADNNTLSKTVNVVDVIKAFAWNAYHTTGVGVEGTGPVSLAIPIGVMTQIAVDEGDFVTAADFVGDELYGIRRASEGNCPLVKIDPATGVVTEIGGGALDVSGFAYDVTTKTAYIMDFNGLLGTINLENGAVTPIGGQYNYAISLACDSYGNLFAISLDDNLAKISKETGEATIIGELGIDINYAQDIVFDRDNNVLYGTLYTTAFTGAGGLYTIDVTTGAATLIADIVDELTGFAIPYKDNGNEDAYGVPYTEDFEEVFPPADWSFINNHTNPNSNWHQGAGNPSTGTGGLEVMWSDDSMMDEWAISPTFDLSNVSGNLEFSFDFLTSYTWLVQADGADIMLKVSTDGGANWTKIWSEEDYGTFTDWSWYSLTLPFDYAGNSNVKFAFHYLGNDGAQVSIDNVKLDFATGINEDVAVKVASVYPNPSDGIVNVNVTEKSVVTVVDLSGRVVASYNVDANETISFRQASGVYMLKVESEGKVSTHKLIVK